MRPRLHTYLRPRRFEKNGDLYEALGIRVFLRITSPRRGRVAPRGALIEARIGVLSGDRIGGLAMVQEVREFRESDAEGMARIYNHYVVNTTVSFETSPVRPADLLERVRKVERSDLPWTVAEDSGEGSIALHENFGMRKVGHFAEMGYKLGRWVDVGYWQRIFPHPFDENGLRER